jgi:hypothetical protein
VPTSGDLASKIRKRKREMFRLFNHWSKIKNHNEISFYNLW